MKEKVLGNEENEASNWESGELNPMDEVVGEMLFALNESGVDKEIVAQIVVSESPEGTEGDFGFHCAPLAKKLRKNPALIASELAEKMQPLDGGMVTKYVAVGQYINAVIDFEKFGESLKRSVFEKGDDYGKEVLKTPQRVVIDMSSPNIAKRMSVGHLRSTIIGDSLARIYSHLGYEVIKDNHLGDWGTQFGHILRAIELWGDDDVISANPIEELQNLYVRISDAGDPKSDIYKGLPENEARIRAEKISNEGRAWFKRLESGDVEARAKWQKIVDWSLKEFQEMYDILGVEFDWVRGESFYEELLPLTIERIKESGIVTESKGALVVNMEDVGKKSALIQKTDGATLYLTREIATAIYRAEVDKVDQMIYVVGEDQKFYFEQFFEILKRAGYSIAEKSKHVYFGMISLPEGKMSTRKGRVVLLKDLVEEAMNRTRKIVYESKRVTSNTEREELVKKLSVGALKWNDLMADPKRSIVFDWDSMLTMEGKSAPYVQYSFVRAMSLLDGISSSYLNDAKIIPEDSVEKKLVTQISGLPEAIKAAASQYDPSKVATYVYELARSFNSFYNSHDVLKETDGRKRKSRLAMTAVAAQTIKIALGLLGIEAPNRM